MLDLLLLVHLALVLDITVSPLAYLMDGNALHVTDAVLVPQVVYRLGQFLANAYLNVVRSIIRAARGAAVVACR